MRIAIAGAHGQIARILTRQLVREGHTVIGLIRNPAQCDDIKADGGAPYVVSLEDASVSEVADAIRDCDAVIFAAGGGASSGRERKWTMDLLGAIKLADAAEAADVKRYVMLSSMGAGTPEKVDAGVFQVYLYAKGGADADLRTRENLSWTILRPGALTDEAPTGLIKAAPELPRDSISRADVAACLAFLVESDETAGRTITVTRGETPIAQALSTLA